MTTTREVAAVEMPPMERLEPIHTKGLQRVFGILRVAMGWTFLWAFIDKLFGLGFATGGTLRPVRSYSVVPTPGSTAVPRPRASWVSR